MRLIRLGLRVGLKLLAVWAVAGPWSGWAQVFARPRAFTGVDETGAATTVEASLRTMAAQADVIFYGTVVSIRRTAGEGSSAGEGAVEVTFAVARAVRGCADGQPYVLREWGGLWAAGAERYHVGSRLLMLLHAPGASGLSSPVGVLDGMIPVKGTGARAGESETATGAAAEVADLRWIAAKLARPVAYAKRATVPAASGPSARPATVATSGIGGRVLGTPQRAEQESSTPAAQAALETVLAVVGGQAREVSDAR